MKHLLIFVLLLFAASMTFGQAGAPKKFNYQAVPRKADGSLIYPNSVVKVQFIITEDGPVNIKYGEEHVTTVSQHGVINAVVGGGSVSGILPFNFDAIDWKNHSYFLAVAVDIDGNGTFESTEKFAASQLLSVPYALYAEKSGSGGNSGSTSYQWGNGIDIDSTTFTINNTGDINPDDDVLKNSNFSQGDVTGSFNNGLEIKANAVTSAEITNQTIQKEDLGSMGAANGQVLKFNSATNSWEPANDDTGGAGGSVVLNGQTPGILVTPNGSNNFTIANTGDINAADDITNTSSAGGDLSGNFSNLQINPAAVGSSEIQNGSIEAVDFGQMGASANQILKWNGSAWAPANDETGAPGGGLTQVAVNTPLSGNGTVGNPILITPNSIGSNLIQDGSIGSTDLAQMGATSQQVLQWDGTKWTPATISGPGGGLTQVAVNAPISGDGTVANPISISPNSIGSNLIQDGAIGTTDLGQMGASNNQILKWNGNAWAPANDETGAPGGGLTQVAVTAPLSGNGTVGNPILISPNSIGSNLIQDGTVTATDLAPGTIPTSLPPSGAASGDLSGSYPAPVVDGLQGFPVSATPPANQQVLKWNGSAWAPANDATGGGVGDDWGTQTAVTTSPVTGNGTAGSPIGIAPNSITGSHIADGSIEATDLATGVILNVTAGPGIALNYNTSPGYSIQNTAPDVPVVLTGTGGTTISGNYPNFTINSPVGGGGGGVGGSGTTGYVPKFTSATTIGNSAIYQAAGDKVGIGTTTPDGNLDINGGELVLHNGVQAFNMTLRADGKMAFEADGVTGDNTLVIDDDGDQSVNIGSATPVTGFKLHVVGKAKFDTGVYFGTNEGFTDGGINEIATNADLRPTIHSTGTNGFDIGTPNFRWRNQYLRRGYYDTGLGIGTNDLANAQLRVIGDESDGVNAAAVKIESPGQMMLLDGNEIDVPGGGLYIHSNSPHNVHMVRGGGAVGMDVATIETGFKLHVGGKAKFDNGVYFGTVEGIFDGGLNEIATNSDFRPNINGSTARTLGTTSYRWGNVYAYKGSIENSMVVGSTNTSASGASLRVVGDESDGSTVGVLKIESPSQALLLDGNEIDATGGLYLHNNSTGNIFMVAGGGKVVVNGAAATGTLNVAGTAYKTGGGSWSSFSDRRLKQNIAPFGAGIELINKIKPVTFHYNGKLGMSADPEYVGIIAQELQEVAPFMVTSTPITEGESAGETYLSVDPSAFTYLLINSVKSQQTEIETLKAQIAAQQAQIDALINGMTALKAAVGKNSAEKK